MNFVANFKNLNDVFLLDYGGNGMEFQWERGRIELGLGQDWYHISGGDSYELSI